MAIRTRDEILEVIKARLGDDTSDEALAIIEDITDTLTDYETKVAGDGTDWKAKFEENDTEWRNKYKERFFSGDVKVVGKPPAGEPEEPEEPEEVRTFDDLFKEGE